MERLRSPYATLDALIDVLGGYKVVAARLWPERSSGEAYLRNALHHHEGRAERLEVVEYWALLRWGKDVGFHGAFHWLCEQIGYENAKPLDPITELQRNLATARADLDESKKALEQHKELIVRLQTELDDLKTPRRPRIVGGSADDT